jgi:hypothetical protein
MNFFKKIEKIISQASMKFCDVRFVAKTFFSGVVMCGGVA